LLQHFNSYNMGMILTYSFLRYLVFATQFVLIWSFYHHSSINLSIYPAIFITYLIASILPVLSLLDWAIKGNVAYFVFSFLDLPHEKILWSVTLMWIMNFFIPFIIGLILYLWNPNKPLHD